MKNFYFSVILFILILSLSLFSNYFIKTNLGYFYNVFVSISETQDIGSKEIYSVTKLKENFSKQKNMLQLFISKEHIKDIETDILLIEHFLYENELSECKQTCIEAISVINQIAEYITSID